MIQLQASILKIIQQMQNAEAEYLKKQKLIKRRHIRHGQMSKARKNKNCPKFIVGYCWYLFQNEILALSEPAERLYAEQSFEITKKWISNGNRDYLNRANLVLLFGPAGSERESLRNFISSKIFYNFLSNKALELVVGNKKAQKPLSYLICLEKLTARLANTELMNKIQFK